MNSFFSLIDQLSACLPSARTEIEAEIMASFQREHTVFALDMSGFSFSVRREGILSHLCKIRRIQQMAAPIIIRFQGEIVKQVADNILAVFDLPAQAVAAALAINHSVHESQSAHGNDPLLSVAIGIDHGSILLIPNRDCFGDAVNIAYKLGEDVAQAGEILITENARQKIGPEMTLDFEPLTLSLSGLTVCAYNIRSEGLIS